MPVSFFETLLERAGATTSTTDSVTLRPGDFDRLLEELDIDANILAVNLLGAPDAVVSSTHAAFESAADVTPAITEAVAAVMGFDWTVKTVEGAGALIQFVRDNFDDITSGIDISQPAFETAFEFVGELPASTLHLIGSALALAEHPWDLLAALEQTSDLSAAADSAELLALVDLFEAMLTVTKSIALTLGAKWAVERLVRAIGESRRKGLESAQATLASVKHLDDVLTSSGSDRSTIERALVAVDSRHWPF